MCPAINYRFVAPGTVATEVGSDELWLDVGNSEATNVIDHHQPGSPNRSTTGMVVAQLGALVERYAGCSTVTIVTHEKPDLDAVCAAWVMINGFKETNSGFYSTLAEYVDRIDAGHTAFSTATVSLYSILNVGFHTGPNEHASEYERDMYRLAFAFQVLDALFEKHVTGFSGLDESLFPSSIDSVFERLEADREIYFLDRDAAQSFDIWLPTTNPSSALRLTALASFQPRSLFFKSWARGDEGLQPGPLLIVGLSPSRTIISVPPTSGVYLKGLGDVLQCREDALRLERGITVSGDNRPGYSNPDPWFDGRGTLHNYTIIDGPRRGTLIGWAEVINIVRSWSLQFRRGGVSVIGSAEN